MPNSFFFRFCFRLCFVCHPKLGSQMKGDGDVSQLEEHSSDKWTFKWRMVVFISTATPQTTTWGNLRIISNQRIYSITALGNDKNHRRSWKHPIKSIPSHPMPTTSHSLGGRDRFRFHAMIRVTNALMSGVSAGAGTLEMKQSYNKNGKTVESSSYDFFLFFLYFN